MPLRVDASALNEAARRAGFRDYLSLLDRGSQDDIRAAFSDNAELAEALLAVRRWLDEHEAGDEELATLILNYLVYASRGRPAPRALVAALARAVPGVYDVRGEKVLVVPGGDVPEEVSLDQDYMNLLLRRLVKIGYSELTIAGVKYELFGHKRVVELLRNTALHHDAMSLLLKKVAEALGATITSTRTGSEGSTAFAEATLTLPVGEGATVPQFTLRVVDSGDVSLRLVYEDEIIHHEGAIGALSEPANYERLADEIKLLVDKLHALRVAYGKLKSIAEQRGYTVTASSGIVSVSKSLQTGDGMVHVVIEFKPSLGTDECVVNITAPASVADVLEYYVKGIKMQIDNEKGVVFASWKNTVYRKEDLEKELLFVDDVVNSLVNRRWKEMPIDELTFVVGIMLIEAYDVIVPADTLVSMGASPKKVDAMLCRRVGVCTEYRNERYLREILAGATDVTRDGEPTVFNRTVDECLAPFGVDEDTILRVKRELVEDFYRYKHASLAAILTVRGVQITPALLRKLIRYGDYIPVAILMSEYEGSPLIEHLSSEDKIALLARLMRIVGNDIELPAEDIGPDIVAKVKCAAGLPECTELAFRELRDELQIPRHAMLRKHDNLVLIDTGAYLISVDHYDVVTGTYAFTVRLKSSDEKLTVRARTLREAVYRAIEFEEEREMQPA